MTPNQLLFAHRYSEAAEAFRTHLIEHPEQNYHDGLGLSQLSLGHFGDAISSFRMALQIERSRQEGNMVYLNELGAAIWLAGEKSSAMDTWHRAISAVLDGSSHYGDSAGGATQGLLLLYGSMSSADKKEHDYAVSYLATWRKKKIKSWPQPVVMMVLGDKSFEEILKIGIGKSDLKACIEIARTDLLKRRFLCQALFYAGCRDREAGDEASCMQKMQACYHLENPIIEVEWYLARGECEKSGDSTRG